MEDIITEFWADFPNFGTSAHVDRGIVHVNRAHLN